MQSIIQKVYKIQTINSSFSQMQIQKNSQTNAQQMPQQQVKFGPFNVFSIIKKSHNSYGIKNTDYRRYRNYCGRKIIKIRKSINYKFGTKNKFIRKDLVKDNANDKKILQISLWKAQKYWAQSNQTKYSPYRNPSQKSRARFVSIKKLKKSIQWSKTLQTITKQRSTYLSSIQTSAYTYYLQGMLAFEQQSWNEAQNKLIAARQIMDQLMKTSTSISTELFKEKIDQYDQTIKFCNFKISKGKDMSVSQIIEMKKIGDPNLSTLIENLTQQRLNEISLQQNTNNNEIRFDNETYPVKEQTIKIQKSKIDSQIKVLNEMKSKALLNIQDNQLQEEIMLQYSKIVVLIQEGTKICDHQRQSGKKNDKYNEAEIQILKKISLLFQQMKISLFIDRSYTIFRYSYNTNKQRKSSPQTLAKLLTTINNNFIQLADLIKEKHLLTGTSHLEELKAIDQKAFYLRTLRLLFVGQVYYNNDKIKEAFGLWQECDKALRILQSKEQMKNEKAKLQEDNDPLKCNLMELHKIAQLLQQARLKCIIKNYKTESKTRGELTRMIDEVHVKGQKLSSSLTLEELIFKDDTDLAISLEKLSEIQIIKLPGALQPVLTRPVFLDIYQNQLNYPILQNKLKKKTFLGKWFSFGN